MTRTTWKPAIEAARVETNDLVGVQVDGREIAVYNLEGRFFATDNVCTHEHAVLSDGWVIDDVIECPLHQGRFHIPTGRPKGAPVHIPLRTYPVKLEGGMVMVEIDEGDKAASRGACPANCPAR